MKTLRLAAFFLALSFGSAQAADNAVIVTPGVGVTMRSKDVGSGVQAMMPVLGDTSGNALATAPGTGNASFALPIQGVSGGVAVPISGTVAATESGTWTVQPGNTANTTAWLFNMGAMGGTAINSGCVSNYGTAPSAVACPSVNAYVTNTNANVEWNADGVAATMNGSPTSSALFAYNGSTFDRLRDDANKNLLTAPQATTAGGWTPKFSAGLSTTVVAIKASGGQLASAVCDGTNTALAYMQVFNVAAASVTLGTTAPNYVVPLQTGVNSGIMTNSIGIQLGTAISAAVTTTPTGLTATGTPPNCSFLYN